MYNVDKRALEVAQTIEDIFARGFQGGRTQRLAAVQVVLVEAFLEVAIERKSQSEMTELNETIRRRRSASAG